MFDLGSEKLGISESKMKSAIPKNAFMKAQAMTLPKCLQINV
jgi:hypothetical protein